LIGIAGGMVSALPYTKGSPLQYLAQTKRRWVWLMFWLG
jgi:hypothetical protein